MLDNRYLFELLNAAPGMHGPPLMLASALADYLILLIPIGMLAAWQHASQDDRLALLRALYACLVALAVGQLIGWLWPQPRPFALHMGTQYLAHADDPGLPSDHVTIFWTLSLAAFATRRFAPWGFPLLAAGLAVGWSRVFLGVHFPLDVVAAFPVAALAVAVAAATGKLLDRYCSIPLLGIHAQLVRRWRDLRKPSQ